MLILRTHWLKYVRNDFLIGEDRFKYTRMTIGYTYLSVCNEGLRKLFKIPPDANRVRFYVYDKPTKNSVEFELVRHWENDSYLRYSRNIQVAISGYVSDRKVRRLLAQQSRYHVECEYL